MPEIHEYRKAVSEIGWAVTDVTAGEDVAGGEAAGLAEANKAADAALKAARAAEVERLKGAGWTFGLDTEEEIEAAFKALAAGKDWRR